MWTFFHIFRSQVEGPGVCQTEVAWVNIQFMFSVRPDGEFALTIGGLYIVSLFKASTVLWEPLPTKKETLPLCPP